MRRVMVVLFLLLGGLVAGAFAGPDKPIGHVKALAGEWRAVGGASGAAIRIKPDGTYEGITTSGARTTGRITVKGSKASFLSTTSEGTVTLSTQGGKDVLIFVRGDGKGSATLQRVK